MAVGRTRPASHRQAELDAWLGRAAGGDVVDLASLRGTLRAPTGLLQQLAEAVLDNSLSFAPEGGLLSLREAWVRFDAQRGAPATDAVRGISIVADPLAACACAILGLVSPGRHVAVVEPAAPQVVEVIRRVGAMARTITMRPTEWEFEPDEFAQRVGPRTDVIVVADPNPLSGQYLPDEARTAILAAIRQFDCIVLLDQSARHSVVGEEEPGAAAFVAALGSRCLRIDVPAAALLAGHAYVAAVMGHPELVGPVSAAATTFGLGAGVSAQGVNARRFADGTATDDIASLGGIVASGRALMLDGLDDIGVLGLGGPGGWYVPVRAKALYAGTEDIGEVLAEQAGLGVLPLAPFFVEGSSDPYILMSYLRDAALLESSLERLAAFYEGQDVRYEPLALPPPDYEEKYPDDDEFDDDEFDDLGDDSTGAEVIHEGDVAAAIAVEENRTPEVGRDVGPGPVLPPQGLPANEEEADRDEYLFRSSDGDPGPEPDGPVEFSQVERPSDPFAAESAQVIEMAEADAKYRAAMAGHADTSGGIGSEYQKSHDGDLDSGAEAVDDQDIAEVDHSGTAGREEVDELRSDTVVLPFARWRESRRARRERRDETVVNAQDSPEHELEAGPALPPITTTDEQGAASQDVPVFRLSVPDSASPDISMRQLRDAEPSDSPEGNNAGSGSVGDPEDVLTLGEEDVLPAPSPTEEDRDAASAEKKPRDDRPFFFDDPVV